MSTTDTDLIAELRKQAAEWREMGDSYAGHFAAPLERIADRLERRPDVLAADLLALEAERHPDLSNHDEQFVCLSTAVEFARRLR